MILIMLISVEDAALYLHWLAKSTIFEILEVIFFIYAVELVEIKKIYQKKSRGSSCVFVSYIRLKLQRGALCYILCYFKCSFILDKLGFRV